VTLDMMYWIESWKPGERPMFLTVVKVMVLRSVGVFSDVPEEILAELASYLGKLRWPPRSVSTRKVSSNVRCTSSPTSSCTCTKTIPCRTGRRRTLRRADDLRSGAAFGYCHSLGRHASARTRPIRTKDDINVFYAAVDVSGHGQLKARSKGGEALVWVRSIGSEIKSEFLFAV